jgi:hypothetical protein
MASCCSPLENIPDLNAKIRRTLPSRLHFVTEGSPDGHVREFLREVEEFLFSDTLSIREVAKEALGSELSPQLFPDLFTLIDLCVLHVLGRAHSSDLRLCVAVFHLRSKTTCLNGTFLKLFSWIRLVPYFPVRNDISHDPQRLSPYSKAYLTVLSHRQRCHQHLSTLGSLTSQLQYNI